MHNNDVTWLFDHTPLGTPVKVINNPNMKPAWEVQQPDEPPTVAEKPAAAEKPQVNQPLQIAGEAADQALLQSSIIDMSNMIINFTAESILKELTQQQ